MVGGTGEETWENEDIVQALGRGTVVYYCPKEEGKDMKQEERIICYDPGLCLEAYRLKGIVQPFPNHFHDYYVIGFLEDGCRRLSCKGEEYQVQRGQAVLFAPGENHACAQLGDRPLDYRGLNIPAGVMLDLTQEITGRREAPGFYQPVVLDQELTGYLRPLHQMILAKSREFAKEETLFLLLSLVLARYSKPFLAGGAPCREEVERACAFLEQNYAGPISLEQICRQAGLSKSALLRAFPKAKGVTPYRYLQTIRIGRAKKLLEEGASPLEAAMETGFADQSHFTHFFQQFIGISPGAYRGIFQAGEHLLGEL